MPKYKVDIQTAIVKNSLAEQPLRVAAYCRVSTDSDEQRGGSVDLQGRHREGLAAIYKERERHGLWIRER